MVACAVTASTRSIRAIFVFFDGAIAVPRSSLTDLPFMNFSSERRVLCCALLSTVTFQVIAQVPSATLPAAHSLPEELAYALHQGQPLVVMVSLDGCSFCRIARQSHLAPMHREGAAIVQVDMRSTQVVRDLDGQMRTHDALVQGWRVKIAPTLLFLGPGGREVAKRMVGAYQPDFYGPYLDERLVQARAAIRRLSSEGT